MLLAVTSVSMASRKRRRYLKNRLMLGSEAMYHDANSIIDQVTNRAIGRNVVEYVSNIRLILILKFVMSIQWRLVVVNSIP